ncbi:MAG: hypothetical protein LBQ27_01910 [Clostridiales bacterium]|jgi:hypothetical protein|nr:hypothetical protein [Clostridiales bacterium]
MKKQNKFGAASKYAVLSALLILTATVLSSCSFIDTIGGWFKPKPAEGLKSITVIIADEIPGGDGENVAFSVEPSELNFTTGASYLFEALEAMKAAGQLTFEAAADGFFTSFGGIELGAGEYIAIYFRFKDGTFDDALMDARFSKPCEYEEKLYYAANVGAASLPLRDGMEIIFAKVYYGAF